MGLNINLILLAAGLLQGITLSFAIWTKSNKSVANLILIALLAVLTLQILIKGLSKVWVLDQLPGFLVLIAYELPLLIAPLAYMYIKKSLQENIRPSRKSLLLFVPFLFTTSILIIFLSFGFSWAEILLPNSKFKLVIHALAQLTLLCYCFMAGKKVIRDSAHCLANKSNSPIHHLTWLNQFNYSILIIGTIIIIALKGMYYYYPEFQEVRYLFLSLVLFVYWLSYKVLSGAETRSQPVMVSLKNIFTSAKYEHSSLRAEQAMEIEKDLIAIMAVKQPHLQAGLTIDDLAQGLDVQKHHLSQVLNDKFRKTFHEFVNHYRVEKAKALLQDPKYNYLTIAGIAFESGFNSVSAFNLVFKKHVGISPSLYKKTKPASSKTG
jgi:AraC-like DNA-binding protein